MARPDVASRAAGGGRWRGRVAALAYLAAFALAIGVNLNPLYRSKPQQMAHDPLLSVSDSAAADATGAGAGGAGAVSGGKDSGSDSTSSTTHIDSSPSSTLAAFHSPPPSPPPSPPLPPPVPPPLPPFFSPPLPPPLSPPPPSPPVFPPPVPLISPPPSGSPPPPSPLLSPPPSPIEETAAAAQTAIQEPASAAAPLVSPADVAGAPPASIVSAADVAADAEEGQESLQAGLTIVNTSSDPGAVCLDGSPPAFNWHPGRGTGRNKWILYLEGGAWCEDAAHCIDRSFSNFGSSTKMGDWLLQGLLSSSRKTNPDFFNWNLVYIRYCDGASFIGNVDEPIRDHEGKPQIYMRGRRVFESIISHLQTHHGMRSASHVLLSGCSAGGLAALLLCDSLADWMRRESGELEGVGGGGGGGGGGEKGGEERKEGGVVMKCMSDGGYFLDARDPGGRYFVRDTMFRPVTAFHNVTLNPHCLASRPPMNSSQCFFPENFLPFLSTPFFILNSLYDSWQIAHSFASFTLFLEEEWHACHMSLQGCDKERLDKIHAYRDEMVAKVSPLLSSNRSAPPVRWRLAAASSESSVNGAYLVSCRAHCMAMGPMWHGSTAPRIHNK
ncbi:unnamed protein product, partial [Closterium sp. NIES-54]